MGAYRNERTHRDVIISESKKTFRELPEGAVIGTSSLRRGAQLKAIRPDVEIKWIRGNIDTRIRKLADEDYDAIVLAAAGLHRMGWSKEIVTEYLDPDLCVPAVGQGALSIECRESDEELLGILEKLNDELTSKTVLAERAFLHTLEGGCQVPIAGHAVLDDNKISVTGLVGEPDGSIIIKEMETGIDPIQVGHSLALRMKEQGAKDILDRVKEELDQ